MSCILPPNVGVEPGRPWFRVRGHGWIAACSEKKRQVNAAVAKMLMVVLGCPCPQLLPAMDLCGSLSPSPEPLQGYRMLLGRGKMQQGTPPHTTTTFSCNVLLSSVHKSRADCCMPKGEVCRVASARGARRTQTAWPGKPKWSHVEPFVFHYAMLL